jgi:hypothetical protein
VRKTAETLEAQTVRRKKPRAARLKKGFPHFVKKKCHVLSKTGAVRCPVRAPPKKHGAGGTRPGPGPVVSPVED